MRGEGQLIKRYRVLLKNKIHDNADPSGRHPLRLTTFPTSNHNSGYCGILSMKSTQPIRRTFHLVSR